MVDPERARLEADNRTLACGRRRSALRINELESRLEEHPSWARTRPTPPPFRRRGISPIGGLEAPLRRRSAGQPTRRSARRPASRETRRGQPARRLPAGPPTTPGFGCIAPTTCGGCGVSLEGAPVAGEITRQVLEIPEPHLEVTDHVVPRPLFSCGCETGVRPGGSSGRGTGPGCWGHAFARLWTLAGAWMPTPAVPDAG